MVTQYNHAALAGKIFEPNDTSSIKQKQRRPKETADKCTAIENGEQGRGDYYAQNCQQHIQKSAHSIKRSADTPTRHMENATKEP